MPTRVKSAHFSNQFKAFSNDVFGQSLATYILAGQSVAHHNFTLGLFNNEVGKNKWANIVEHLASCLPVIDGSSERLFACPSIARIFLSAKNFLKPYDQCFIAARNLEHRMKLKTVSILALFDLAKIKAAFTVYYSSKIRDLSNGLVFIKDNYFGHDKPFIVLNDYDYIIINEQCDEVHAERLSEKDPQGYAIV